MASFLIMRVMNPSVMKSSWLANWQWCSSLQLRWIAPINSCREQYSNNVIGANWHIHKKYWLHGHLSMALATKGYSGYHYSANMSLHYNHTVFSLCNTSHSKYVPTNSYPWKSIACVRFFKAGLWWFNICTVLVPMWWWSIHATGPDCLLSHLNLNLYDKDRHAFYMFF